MAKKKVMLGSNSLEVGKMKSYLDRVQKLDDEISDLSDDRKEVWAEAKSNGYDVPTMRKILRELKLKADARTEKKYMFDLYAEALELYGMFE